MRVSIPSDLAENLVDADLAKPVGAGYRLSIVEWIVEGAGVGSTVVTLLGSPMVVKFYADWLKGYVRKRGEPVVIEIRDPATSDLVKISTEDSMSDIAEKIRPYLSMS